MYKFTIMTPVKGIIIAYLALNKDLAKSISDTTVLLFVTIYCLVMSLLTSVKQVFPNNWNAIINGTLWKKSHAWNISIILISSYVNAVINAGDISFHSAIYVERNLEIFKYLQQ